MKTKLLILTFLLTGFVKATTARYRIMFNTNPSSEITIGWDQVSGTTPVVYYGTTDFGTAWASYPNQKAVDRTITYRQMNNNFVRLTGLLPNTAYYFVIKDSQGTSSRFWFKTCPNDLSRLSFISGGDSRNNRTPRVNANKLVAKLKPHAVLFGGDAINTDSDANIEWKEWFDDWQFTNASDGRMFPVVITRGNHEASGTMDKLFDVGANEYYAVTFGNNLFRCYTLNTEIAISATTAQTTWLSNDLTLNSSVHWKAAQFHKPMRPHESAKAEGTAQYAAWAQMFYDKDVKLVMDSDSHCVKTTWPLRPSSDPGNDEGFVRDDNRGTVFIGEGCWGAPLRPADDNKSWTRNSGSFNEFKLLWVDVNKIEIRTIQVDNADLVAENTNANPFALPGNISVWNPSNGDVVIINKSVITPKPEIEFTPMSTMRCFDAGTNVLHSLNFLNNGSTITDVKFYVDNVLVYTDVTAPYEYLSNYTSGAHTISITATGSDGQTDSVSKDFFVGFSTQTLTFPILSVDDDAEQNQNNGILYGTSSDLELVYDSTVQGGNAQGYQNVGLRFNSIKIPQGAIINSAYIQFTAKDASSSPCSLQIQIEDSEDAQPYVDQAYFGVTDRTYLTDVVNWSPAAWTTVGAAGAAERTADLSALIQKVINKTNWNEGGAVAFKINGTGTSLTNTTNKRNPYSFDGGVSTGKEPKLVVNFTYACCGALTTNWNGTTWTNGVPNKLYEATFSANYNAPADLEACAINVTNNAQVQFNTGKTLTVKNDITIDNGANLIIENDAALNQISNDAVNTGLATVKRNSTPMVRLDYTAWSSPVTGQQLKAFSPNTLDNRFYQYLYTGTTTPTAFQSVNPYTNFIKGKGYLIRTANDWPTSLTTFNGLFSGVLNNGDVSQNVGVGYNLIGNPYPSPLSANVFFDENPSVGTLYFWNHNSTAVGGVYPVNNYASRTKLGGVAAASGGAVPNAYIQTGQGFYVNSSTAGEVFFTNTQRAKATASTQFFKNTTQSNQDNESHVYRLNLSDNVNAYNQILIGYASIASNGFDNQVDGLLINENNTSLFSVLNNNKLVIQGRAWPFADSDVVPLGVKINEAGNYTISFENAEGLFNSQNIYLKDNLTNSITDIKFNSYNFNSTVGTFNDRFEIIYTNSALSTQDFEINNLVVFTKNQHLFVKTDEAIENITIYDVQGRLILNQNDIKSKEWVSSKFDFLNQVFIVKVKTITGKEKTTKVIL